MAFKTNNKQILPNECGSALEIQVSWLSYGDIKIWDTFVYEYTPALWISFLRAFVSNFDFKNALVLIGYLYV